ncbi:HIT family protein [Stomatohabitans albus]|uniref:HIT family protein n=1 Tax=Stomatohabitans albus TaxID=3110766 RepID=UPI00300C014A
MSTVFTKIINRELPGRFIYEDDVCVVFLTIEPLTPGHCLVVPRAEIPTWLELDDPTRNHLFAVAQRMGRAVTTAFGSPMAALIIAGFDVPHTHLHVVGAANADQLHFAHATNPGDAALDDAAERLRAALEQLP